MPRCYGNVGSFVVVSDPTMRLSDKDFQFVKDNIKWVKYSLVFVTIYIYNILMLKKYIFKADFDNKMVNSFISIMVLIKLIKLLTIITV